MGEWLASPWFWPTILGGGAGAIAIAALVFLSPVYKHIVCLKYLFSGWKAVVPLISALPAALGVFLLILVFAIMDGFVSETREMTRGTLADIIVDAHLGGMPYYDEFTRRIERIDGVEAATPVIRTYAVARIKPRSSRIKPIVRPCLVIGIRPAGKAKMGRFLEYLQRQRFSDDTPPERLEHLLDVPEGFRKAMEESGRLVRPGVIPGTGVIGVPGTDYVSETVEEGAGRRVLLGFLAVVAAVVFLFVWRAGVRRPGRVGWRVATAFWALVALGLVVSAIVLPVRPVEVMRAQVVDYPLLAYGEDLVVSTIPIRPSGAVETDLGGVPRVSTRALTLVDTFKSNYWEADSSHVYVSFDVAQRMAGMEGGPDEGEPARASRIQVKLSDPSAGAAVVEKIRRAWEAFGAEHSGADLPLLSINTWETQQQMILTVVEIERNITTLMLGLMFLGFGVLIGLISYVMAYIKSRDVGILKALGASDAGVGSLFLGYGFIIGLLGTALGLVGALLMLHYLDPIEIWVNQTLGVDVFPREMYYFEHIPWRLSLWWCVGVSAGALALSTLASMAGGLLAAFKQPVEALRYE